MKTLFGVEYARSDCTRSEILRWLLLTNKFTAYDKYPSLWGEVIAATTSSAVI